MKTIIIEIYRETGQWKMSAFYKGESMGHRHYSVQKVSERHIEELCSDIFNILSRADYKGFTTENSLEELRKSANLLYDQVLSREIKDEIKRTQATHLIFYIDEQLVFIPWELLYDGSNYLCLRFAVGRVVLTAREIHSNSAKEIPERLKMLAVCDPTGDLKSAYQEGIVVRNEVDRVRNRVQLELRTTEVDSKYILKNLREYDAFHFAGHARYDENDPSKSSLLLKGEELTAHNIMALGGATSMPFLVFANACSSGETERLRVDPEYENRIYGLANAFLLTGVKHYIGTFWKVQDGLSMEFSRQFYRHIIQGRSIGESLRQARLYLIEKRGQNALIWASYMLYGDPDDPLIAIKEKPLMRKMMTPRNMIIAGIAVLGLGVLLWYNMFGIKDKKPVPVLNILPYKNVVIVEKDGSINKYDEFNVFGRNIAVGKKAYASSVQTKYQGPEYAVDNNLGTRWASTFSDNQWIYVDLGEPTSIGNIRLLWQIAAGRFYEIQVSNDGKKWKTVWFTSGGGSPSDVINITDKHAIARYVRMYGKKRATEWGYSLFEFEIYPYLLPNVALGKKAFASSGLKGYSAKNAFDGNMGTRWGSEYSDPQWIYVDLKDQYKINMTTLYWEYAYGRTFKIQRSDDGKNWIDVCEIKDNNRTENSIYFEHPIMSRYIRLLCTERGTEWGYSLWEFEVHGIKEE